MTAKSNKSISPNFLLFLLLIFMTSTLMAKLKVNTISFPGNTSTVFPNPERGWHNRYEIINDSSVSDYVNFDSEGCGDDISDRTFACALASGNTLIHSYLHLDKFQNTNILPQSFLANLSSGLAAIRQRGLKVILRPAYTWDIRPSASEALILGHIEQINAVLSANADVVMHLEVGYLGKWGEWHSGLYTDLTNRSEADVRYRIVKKILDTTPETMPIAMRYPISLKEVLELSTPAGSTPLTRIDRDRLGHHNDCFLYNESDRGTYSRDNWMGDFSTAEEKQYTFDIITSYGGNKIMGGETCQGNGRNDEAAMVVLAEMAELNFTEINVDFWSNAIDVWQNANLAADDDNPAETAFNRIARKIGYRLRLIDAAFPTEARAGGSFTLLANLSNDGFAGVVKPRPIYLVFQSDSHRYNIPLSKVDVRTWVSGPVLLSEQKLILPSGMPSGTYTLALWLPDYYPNLQSRPEYSIRFANQGIWDATNGYNVLSNSIAITGVTP